MQESTQLKSETQPPTAAATAAAVITRRRQRDLFQAELPDRPYCMAHKKGGMLYRPLYIARNYPIIQVNPPWLTWCLPFDIDKEGEGMTAWHTAELPEPLATASDRITGRGHVFYALAAPVLTGIEARQKPQRLLSAIEGAMTERMGADPAYTGLVAKNPLHGRKWRVNWSRNPARYELKFLADWLSDSEIKRHWPCKWNKAWNEREATGTGRNVATFDATRQWAYYAIREYWPVTGEARRPAFNAWQDACTNRARDYNATEHNYPMGDSECRAIGKSISRWTWKHMHPETLAAIKSAAARRSGIKSGMARRANTADRDAAIITDHAAGISTRKLAAEHGMTQSGIMRILRRNQTAGER